MILYHWRGDVTNFGDELNTLLWPVLLPDFFDNNPSVRFLGIGSVLDRRHTGPGLKLVAGSGYGGYEGKPRLDSSWIVHWVRGPLTARNLGLDPALGLGDPAALLPDALDLTRLGGADIGFMPHFESAERGAWPLVATLAGVRLIDPREPPRHTLAAMAACRLIISEALHGIIVADALRIPWIAVRPLARIHRAKWRDWSATLGLQVRFSALPASTRRERIETGLLGQRPFNRLGWKRPGLSDPAGRIHRAAAALSRLTEQEPQLSGDADLDRCQARQLDALIRLRQAPLVAPMAAHSAALPSPDPLRAALDSGCRTPVAG